MIKVELANTNAQRYEVKMSNGLSDKGEKRDNKGNRMSAFAQSAYDHATRESTPPRHSLMGNLTNKIKGKGRANDKDAKYDYNLQYYPNTTIEGTIVSGLNNNCNMINAEAQPLAGASILIITDTSKQDKLSCPRVRKIMEERENIGYTIESLGGIWRPALESEAEGITHAIWIGSDDGTISQGDTVWKRIATDALNKLSICQSMDIRKSLQSVLQFMSC